MVAGPLLRPVVNVSAMVKSGGEGELKGENKRVRVRARSVTESPLI